MTNSEINLNCALKALKEGRLTAYEAEFVNSIKDYTKKELRNLSSKQYKLLREISNKL